MKNIALLTEYGITGTLLTFNLFIFGTLLSLQMPGDSLTLNFHDAFILWTGWFQKLADALGPLGHNDAITSAANAVLATLATLFIFCTGFLLEITAPLFFTILEMAIFRRWLTSSDQVWIEKIVERNQALVKKDFEGFTKVEQRRWFVPRGFLRHRQEYNRLRSFVFSYLFVYANDVNTDELTGHIRLWHTTRAVATSMIYLGVLLTCLSVTGLDNAGKSGEITNEAMLLSVGVPLLLFIGSALLTLAIFSRLCNILRSLIFLVDQRVAQ